MAHGAGPDPLIKDPALERFYRYRETYGNRFRVTPKNLSPLVLLMVVIPAGLAWVAYDSQGKYLRYPKRRSTPAFESEYKLP